MALINAEGDQASEVIYMSSPAVTHTPDEGFDKFRRQRNGELDGTIFLVVWRNRRYYFSDSCFLP